MANISYFELLVRFTSGGSSILRSGTGLRSPVEKISEPTSRRHRPTRRVASFGAIRYCASSDPETLFSTIAGRSMVLWPSRLRPETSGRTASYGQRGVPMLARLVSSRTCEMAGIWLWRVSHQSYRRFSLRILGYRPSICLPRQQN